MFCKVRNYCQSYWLARCQAHARSTGVPCRRKVVADKDGGLKARCCNHGAAPGAGKQTEAGRRGEKRRERRPSLRTLGVKEWSVADGGSRAAVQ
jgi:hypothetical protein